MTAIFFLQEIQFIMDTRMELMESMALDRKRAKEEKANERMERLASRLGQRRDKQINDIRGKFQRDLRKLRRKHRAASAASCKKLRPDIIDRYADRTSWIYAPELRFGEKSAGRHEILDKALLRETYIDGENNSGPIIIILIIMIVVNTDTSNNKNSIITEAMPPDDVRKWLPTEQQLQEARPLPGPADLCVRQTRWSDEKLRKLHADLKAIRLNIGNKKSEGRPSLLKRKFKAPPLPVTPMRSRTDRGDNHLDDCSLLVQKITRGRAVQCMVRWTTDVSRCRQFAVISLLTLDQFLDVRRTRQMQRTDR